jgi:1,2-diacylglycerol 3-beta-galactosyltransferase
MREYVPMGRVEFVYFDAGGGHRAAATALRIVTEQQLQWNINLMNLQELLDVIDPVLKLAGLRLQDLYNLLLKKGWTWGTGIGLRVLQAAVRLYHPHQVRLLEAYWRKSRPALVVSLVPHFNRALFESLRRITPTTPLVTILTDLADYPPHFWLERQDQFYICGSERAVAQALSLGLRPDRVYRTSGMILHPKFYQLVAADRAAERQRLGLDPALPTGLVMFGGHGSSVMVKIARRLEASSLKLQLILVCGHNDRLAAELRRIPGRKYVEGFTTEVPYYMHLSDFFIGKPGPGSISEALAMKLPVIVECNARTLPQERYNAAWVVEKQVGLTVRSFRHINQTVEALLDPLNFARYRSNAAAVNNRAVFEIPGMLQEILAKSRNREVEESSSQRVEESRSREVQK